MTKEASFFTIQPETIVEAKSIRRMYPTDEDYNHEINKRIFNEQPFLHEHFTRVSQESPFNASYDLGSFEMCDVISRQMEKMRKPLKLTQEDIKLHEYNYQQNGYEMFSAHYWDNIEDIHTLIADTSSQNDLSEFLGKFETSVPELYQEFAEIVAEVFTTSEERRFFARGVYDSFMPFYRKKEAEHLFNTLYQTTNQQNE